MRPSNMLQAQKVKSLNTRFYYKEEKLCFQITLQYGEDSLVKVFEDYPSYKKIHDRLVSAINNNAAIINDFIKVGL